VSDGAGLFTGVIKHLLARGPDCPKVLAATHFHDVFTPGQAMLDVEEMPATFVHMQVLLSLEDDALYSEVSAIVVHSEEGAYGQ
jgi:DNA mismatch repair protein MSH5